MIVGEITMNFNFSEDQLLLQKTVRKFTEREIEPIAGQIDREAQLPNDLIKKMGQMGLFGMTLPKRYGGAKQITYALFWLASRLPIPERELGG